MSTRQKLVTATARWPIYPLLGVTLIVALWGLISLWTDPTLLPSPAQVFRAFLTTFSNGEFAGALLATLKNICAAFLIGSAVGIALGLIVGGLKPIELLLAPYIYSAYSLPKIALIPLFVVWLGIGPKTIIVVTSIAVALLVAVNTIDGVKSIDTIYIRAAQNLGAGQRQIFLSVILPAASGLIFSGLRLGIGQALITGVAGEIVLSGSGLGAMMWDSQQTLRTDVVFVCLFALAVMGALATALLGSFDRILFPWRPREIE